LAPVLRGESTTSRAAPLFWRRPPDRKFAYGAGPLPDLSVREGDWKLLCEYNGSQPELYNLKADPGETANVAAQHPDVVRRLAEVLLAWNKTMPADHGPALGSESKPKPANPKRKKTPQ
ncbi:MAG: N-acetylgalactosamine-6-sulfatase, partial [Rhodopirellula sp.]|nr:N-acetylgalactosamine-6-sulfatase [Rhodopirellula sp.]